LPGFVDSTVKEIDARLAELEGEVKKLQAARAALVGTSRGPGRPRATPAAATADATATAATPRRRAGRRAGRRPGRPRGRRTGGTRAAQALALVQSRPGIKIPEIAKELKIEPNYLYRVMPALVSEGQIKRDADKGYSAA
jgi:hypothetical protein